MLQGRVLKISI